MSDYHRSDELYGLAYFVCLLDYFKKKNILYHKFKMKDFIEGDQYNCSGGFRVFKDIGLDPGKIRYAISFGKKMGYIREISKTYRKFYLPLLRRDGFVES